MQTSSCTWCAFIWARWVYIGASRLDLANSHLWCRCMTALKTCTIKCIRGAQPIQYQSPSLLIVHGNDSTLWPLARITGRNCVLSKRSNEDQDSGVGIADQASRDGDWSSTVCACDKKLQHCVSCYPLTHINVPWGNRTLCSATDKTAHASL